MNKKAAVIFLLILLAVAGVMTLYLFSKRVKMDPSNTGNTSGNLQNGGLFFEMDGKVYFANASDDYCLYSMNLDESKPKRLTSMGAKYISGADGFLYFYMDSTKKSSKISGFGAATNQFGLYRCKTNGQDQTCLIRDFCGQVQLCGEYLYYQILTNGGSLHKIKCNKTDDQLVAEELISPFCYDNGYIYYTGVNNDHDIHVLNTRGGDMQSTAITGHYFYPVVQDGYLYYLNGDSNYSIWRTNLSTGEQQLVTSDRVDCFTLDRNYIYYAFSNAESPSLRRCNLDGSDKIIVHGGVVNSINVTSKYIYFKEFGNDDIYYHIPIDLSATASPFSVKVK
ncbi:DUF5050 domain-containing protein [Butyrivibrio sp. AE2032]|uniref:DUF5050 domain-containing protein n=1 Tax=Butyrivibrio sp. AE2032 TaxID=1458463 RepID=UPI000552B856|nr:DUF5050 domain-containing protein [Butyrivibrio sp. AE2032]